MRKTKIFASVITLAFFVSLISCNKSDDAVPALELISATIDGKEIAGATAATGVSTSKPILLTFSKDVDEASTSNAFSLSTANKSTTLTVQVSGKIVTLTPATNLDPGAQYTFTIKPTLKAKDGGAYKGLNVSFKTFGKGIVTPPQAASQIAYWTFDGNTKPNVGNFVTQFEKVSYGTDRAGFAGNALSFGGAPEAGQGDIVEFATGDNFISKSMTFSVWFKINPDDYESSKFMFGCGVERGFFMELGSGKVSWMKFATSHKVVSNNKVTDVATAWDDPNGDGRVEGEVIYDYSGSIADLIKNREWHHLVMTFDAATAIKTIYLNGIKLMQTDLDKNDDEWKMQDMMFNPAPGLDKTFTLGYAGSRANTATDWAKYQNATNTFKGMIDDLRVFNVALSESEVITLFNAEK